MTFCLGQNYRLLGAAGQEGVAVCFSSKFANLTSNFIPDMHQMLMDLNVCNEFERDDLLMRPWAERGAKKGAGGEEWERTMISTLRGKGDEQSSLTP
jgi:hypothetical protein